MHFVSTTKIPKIVGMKVTGRKMTIYIKNIYEIQPPGLLSQ